MEALKRRKRILLVDDEPRNLLVLEGCLEPLGHELVRATSGSAAIELLDGSPPDLVLLDMRMPGLDGIDVLTHIRARDGEGAYVPVILVTADGERDQRLRGLEAGADDFLTKPIDRAILVARVRTLLRLKEATDAVAERNARLERLREEQRELSAFIVHDLKNPIAVAQMNVEWVLSQLSGAAPEIKEGLSDAREAIGRLRTMVGDLLTISRLEHDQVPMHRERIEVRSLLNEIARAHAREAQEKRIAMTVGTGAAIEVAGDPGILRRLFENVVENALRHTPQNGRIALDATTGDEVEIAVANSGRAIPADDRSRIFDKRTRGRDEERSPMNLGLGLYFCKRAAEVHGGRIDVRHSEEWATSFVICLPAA